MADTAQSQQSSAENLTSNSQDRPISMGDIINPTDSLDYGVTTAQLENQTRYANFGEDPSLSYRRKLMWFTAILLAILLVVSGTSFAIFQFTKSNKNNSTGQPTTTKGITIPLEEISNKARVSLGQPSRLDIMGTVNITGVLNLNPESRPINPQLGTIYLDSNDHKIYYYNGTSFIEWGSNTQQSNIVLTQPADYVKLLPVGDQTAQTGNLAVTGSVAAGSFAGSGSGLTNLNAGSISTGQLSNSYLVAGGAMSIMAGSGLSGGGSVVLGGSTLLNLANTSVLTGSYGANNSVASFSVDQQGRLVSASNVSIAIDSSQIISGVLVDSRLSSNVTLQGNNFNGTNQLIQTTAMGEYPALNGGKIANLNGNNISTGIVSVGVGGTGQGSINSGDLLVGSAGNTMAKLGVGGLNTCLISNGLTPVWGSCNTGGGGFTNLTLAGSSGTPQIITDTDTMTIAAGTNINTTAGPSGTVTVSTVNTPTFSGLVLANGGLAVTGNLVVSGGTINTATISGGTLSGGTVSGGSLSTTTVNGVNTANIVVTSGSYADPAWLTSLNKSKVGLGNVENTTLSTWAGSANINTLGTITSGSWTGAVIADSYVADNLTVSSAGSVDWSALNNYPVACSAGQAINGLGDTPSCMAFAPTSGSTSYIQNQNVAQQAASNYWISGSGRADTSFLTPVVDVATAGTLSVGTSTATAITLGKSGITTTNAGALTVSQLLTANLGATINGAAISLNDNSNFNTNINTGNSTGTVTVGGNSVLFKNTNNSTTSFQIQPNGSTEPVFNVDTTNLRVGIGTDAPTTELEVVGDITSTGTKWTARTAAAANSWRSVTYGNGLFVAVSSDGTNRVMTSPDGINWTARTAAAANSWRSVTYGNGLFVAVSSDGTAMSSYDGANWGASTTSFNEILLTVVYGNGKFVAGGSLDNRYIYTSSDGINWNEHYASSLSLLEVDQIAYGNGKFAAVNYNDEGIATSIDGIVWTYHYADTGSVGYTSIAYGDGLFVSGSASSGGLVATSPDGIYWKIRNVPVDTVSTIYADGMFVAVGVNSVMTSGKQDLISVNNNNTYQGGLKVYGASQFISDANSTTAFSVQGNTGAKLLNIDTINNIAILGQGSSLTGQLAFANSTNNNTISITPTVATANRSIFLPDADGTICLQNSTNCGFTTGSGTAVLLAPAVAQTDNTTNSSISINKTAVSGNLLQLQKNGSDVFTVGNTGNTTLKNTSNSTNAFQIQDATGLTGLNYDTTNHTLTVSGPVSANDGSSWISRTSATDNNWTAVTYGNSLFVAVSTTGTGNRVMTSPDGITWTSRTSAADNNWTAVTYGNGLFVAVANTGTGNRVMTSPDGINWAARTSATDNNWLSVTYGNGLFVAVAGSGTGNRVMTSPDGINWTSRTSAADNQWISVTYGNGIFVAVSATGTGNRVMTSPDGINWTSRTSAADNQWISVTYGNGLFVAVSYDGKIMSSINFDANLKLEGKQTIYGDLNVYGNTILNNQTTINGTQATINTTNTTINGNTAIKTNNQNAFTVQKSAGSNMLNVNTNELQVTVGNTNLTGVDWAIRTSAADMSWSSITYGNGLFVAVATSGTGNRVMTSPDGINWTARTSAADNNWTSVTYGNGLFVAVSTTGTGNRVMTSPDGITWTTRTSATDNNWYSVTYGNGLFVAVAYSGTGNRVMTSGTLTPSLVVNGTTQIDTAQSGKLGLVVKGATGQTADLLQLQNTSSSSMFSVGATGQAIFQNSADSTSAFQVSNTAGSYLFKVNTSGNNVAVSTDFIVDSEGYNNGLTSYAIRFGSQYSQQAIGSKRTSGGNQYGLDFYTNGNNVFNLSQSGSAVFKNGVDSTTAFSIQNSSGSSLLTADTIGMKLTVQELVVSANLTVNGHIITAGSTPTITAGVATCTTPAVSVTGNDTAGTLNITTGTGCSATGVLATLTFNKTFTAVPHVNLTPTNANATNIKYFRGSATTAGFSIDTAMTPSDSTNYTFDYWVAQ